MKNQIIQLILAENKWLFTAMLVSAIVVLSVMTRRRRQALSRELEILRAMNLFFGCTIGIMSFGHLLAVTVKLSMGQLDGSLWFLYPLGLFLMIPAWWLAGRVTRFVTHEPKWRKGTAVLNAWLGIGLVALGFHNLPLAIPAAFNIAYAYYSAPAVRWTIVTIAVIANVALFIGATIFMASGQSFEQFQRM
jgi:hypothetical protein